MRGVVNLVIGRRSVRYRHRRSAVATSVSRVVVTMGIGRATVPIVVEDDTVHGEWAFHGEVVMDATRDHESVHESVHVSTRSKRDDGWMGRGAVPIPAPTPSPTLADIDIYIT